MVTYLSPPENIKYICTTCDYNTYNKKDYNKHLKTKKHEIRTNDYNKVTQCNVNNNLSVDYICDCEGYINIDKDYIDIKKHVI